MWYMKINQMGTPIGWRTEPSEGYIEVTDEVRSLHENNPEWLWNGITLSPPPEAPEPTIEEAKASKLIEIANARYTEEISGLTLPNGATIKTDRESQAQLNSAYTTLLNGVLTEIDWKADGGLWVKLSLSDITPIVQAVAVFIQSLFTKEKAKCADVEACTTVAQVEAISW